MWKNNKTAQLYVGRSVILPFAPLAEVTLVTPTVGPLHVWNKWTASKLWSHLFHLTEVCLSPQDPTDHRSARFYITLQGQMHLSSTLRTEAVLSNKSIIFKYLFPKVRTLPWTERNMPVQTTLPQWEGQEALVRHAVPHRRQLWYQGAACAVALGALTQPEERTSGLSDWDSSSDTPSLCERDFAPPGWLSNL